MKEEYVLRLWSAFGKFEKLIPDGHEPSVTEAFDEMVAVCLQAAQRLVNPENFGKVFDKLFQEATPLLWEFQAGKPNIRKPLFMKVEEAIKLL